MKSLLVVLSMLMLACSSPSEPDPVISGKIVGTWEGRSVFIVQIRDGQIWTARETYQAPQLRQSKITVNGPLIYFEAMNALDQGETMYYEGEINGSQIMGKYWLSYDKNKYNLILVKK